MQEFKSHLSRYVSQAQSGQLIELTSHRKVVARIVGVPPTDSAGVSCLLAAGVATWQGGKPAGASFRLQEHGKLVSALVLEDRG
jgi:antitoxin (DNA-binding transcriptional repressor) of toxin-antitoxin stability system